MEASDLSEPPSGSGSTAPTRTGCFSSVSSTADQAGMGWDVAVLLLSLDPGSGERSLHPVCDPLA